MNDVATPLAMNPDLDPDLTQAFGFDEEIDAWMRRVSNATCTPELGELAGYRLEALVARGGQGTVYRAVEPGTGRRVALKRIPVDHGDSARARFEREAEIVASLQHPGIVTLLSLREVGDQRLLVMEWIDGLPFDRWADWVRSTRASEDAVRIITGATLRLTEAIAHAHRNGVIHRDLKPSNVLVDAEGNPHVLDFGLACTNRADERSLTRSSGFIGTPSYAAPEQVSGRGVVDARADVHAIGAMLYRSLTGAHPFDEKAPLPELFRQIAEITPTSPSRSVAAIGRDLSLVVLKALAKEPERRYQSMDELAADLRRWMAREPVLAHPTQLTYVLRKTIARHRGAFVIVSLLALSLMAAAVVSTTLAVSLSHKQKDLVESQERADRRADEALQAKDRAVRTRTFLQDMFAAVREASANGAAFSVGDMLRLARDQIDAEHSPPDVEADLRETLGRAYQELGDAATCEELYRSVVELRRIAHPPDRIALARALAAQAYAGNMFTPAHRVMSLLDEAMAIYKEEGDPCGYAEAIARATIATMNDHGPDAAIAVGLKAVEAAKDCDDARRRSAAYTSLALAYSAANDTENARLCALESVQCLRTVASEHSEEMGRALHNLAYVLLVAKDWEGCVAAARESVAIRDALFGPGYPRSLGSRGFIGRALRDSGELDQAVAELEKGAELGKRHPHNAYPLVTIRYHLVRTILQRNGSGDMDRAVAEGRIAIDEMLASLGPRNERGESILNIIGRALLDNGRRDQFDELLVTEPKHWAELCPNDPLAADIAMLGLLHGADAARGSRNAKEIAGAMEQLAPRLIAALESNDQNSFTARMLWADARRHAGDLEGALVLVREGEAIGTQLWGPRSEWVRGARNRIESIEGEMAKKKQK